MIPVKRVAWRTAMATIFSAVVLAGCSLPGNGPAPDPSGAGAFKESRPTSVEGPFRVTSVTDGDTIRVTIDGYSTRVRLIGIDTPEVTDPRKPVQCFGQEASRRAHDLMDGTQVWLEYDPSQSRRDRYGRTLAYVWLSDAKRRTPGRCPGNVVWGGTSVLLVPRVAFDGLARLPVLASEKASHGSDFG